MLNVISEKDLTMRLIMMKAEDGKVSQSKRIHVEFGKMKPKKIWFY